MGKVYSPYGTPEWRTGVYLAQYVTQPRPRLDPLCSDTDFDDRLHWAIQVVPDVRISQELGGRFFVALCGTNESRRSELRVYDQRRIGDAVPVGAIRSLVRFHVDLPIHYRILASDIDHDGDDELLADRVMWPESGTEPRLVVYGLGVR